MRWGLSVRRKTPLSCPTPPAVGAGFKPALSPVWGANPVTHRWPHHGNVMLDDMAMKTANRGQAVRIHGPHFTIPIPYVL